jgi:hypothetical protein
LWQNAVVLQLLTALKEWKFLGVLPKADPGLAGAWWAALLLRGILPAAFAILSLTGWSLAPGPSAREHTQLPMARNPRISIRS